MRASGARSGICDRHELAACGFVADGSLHTIEEMLTQDARLERVSRFARDDEHRPCEIEVIRLHPNLCRIGGIEDVECRKAVQTAERCGQHVRAQAGTAHSEYRVRETRLAHVVGDRFQVFELRELLIGNGEPAKPSTFVGSSPERRVVCPQLAELAVGLPFIYGF